MHAKDHVTPQYAIYHSDCGGDAVGCLITQLTTVFSPPFAGFWQLL